MLTGEGSSPEVSFSFNYYFLQDALYCYESKYGTYIRTGEYMIIFTPTLSVIKLLSS